MAYTFAELTELPNIISHPRFGTYMSAAAGDDVQALKLYEWNLQLSSAFIVPLQICEVAIRNAIAEAIEAVHGPLWPYAQGFVRSLPQARKAGKYDPAKDLALLATRHTTTGKIVAELTFAFWEHLLTVGQEQRLWTSQFTRVFPGAPAIFTIPSLRAITQAELREIRLFRNRIAHHEPIFRRNLSADYRRIINLTSWRSPTAAAWMERIQAVTTLIQERPS